MQIAIHHAGEGAQPYPERWAEFAKKKGIVPKLVDLTNVTSMAELRKFDAILCRWSLSYPGRLLLPMLLDILEDEIGMTVYPNNKTRWSWDDKIKQHLLFSQYGVRMPKTWIFYQKGEAMAWAESAAYPVVFKLTSGASSRNVVLVRNAKEAARLITRMFTTGLRSGSNLSGMRDGVAFRENVVEWKRRFWDKERWNHQKSKETIEKSYVYFQELVHDNAFDTRISIIGNRAFGFRRFNRNNDFRASGSGRISWEQGELDIKAVQTAFEISRRIGFQSMAYDFVKNREGENLLLEACWTFADWAVEKCPGHWDQQLRWVDGHQWPEEAQIEDLIGIIESRK